MNYYNQVNTLIEDLEVNKKVRILQNNLETLLTYWNIGKLIVEAQGGTTRAKYGNKLIKEWSEKLTKEYGNGYSDSNLKRFRKFFMLFQKGAPLRHQLNWIHIKYILPIKDINKRNYYINQVVLNNLSSRELVSLIKSNAFERLSYADKNNIEIISNDNEITIEDMIKDPIIINISDKDKKIDEKVFHKEIINLLENRFLELGTGFALIGHEYKIIIGNKTYKIDLLFFNIELNSYIVVEVKLRELQHKDISQLQFYVNYVEKNIKKIQHNKTIGIYITTYKIA